MIQQKPCMQPHAICSTCYFACKSMTTLSNISLEKKWFKPIISATSHPLSPYLSLYTKTSSMFSYQLTNWTPSENHRMWPSVQHPVPTNPQGWSNCLKHVSRIAYHFWGAQDELPIETSILLKGDQVCIPLKLLNHTLIDLDSAHQGMKKCSPKPEMQFTGPASMET